MDPTLPDWLRKLPSFLPSSEMYWASAWRRLGPTPVRPTFDPPFPNHYLMHGSGKFGLAGLCNLDQLPPTGTIVVAAPLKIAGGSGSPVRAISILP